MPWRGPEHADDFPSLGWALLDWWAEFLPSPRDPKRPLLFTDEQAMQLIEWFRLDPLTGRLVYRRGYSRRSKGWGKSPVEAAKAIAELAGPVRFDGWDAQGEPVARPWGLKNDPRAWVQIGAISEDQTDNTWSVVHYLLTENDGRCADALGIDAGLTRCFLRNQPGAKLEPVTSAAGSREGQPITYGVIDESHLMTPSNGGVKLARTIRRNVAKMGGRSYETTNSFIIGQESVAESSYNAVRKGSPGIFADEVEAPRQVDGVSVDDSAPDEVLLAALDVAYGKSWWVDRHRLVADIRDPSNPWPDSARFFFNWNTADGAGWKAIPRDAWTSRTGAASELTGGVAALSVGPDMGMSSLGFAARRTDGRLQIEVVRHEPGTAWVVAACRNAYEETRHPIVVDPKSPTSGVLTLLRDEGIPLEEVSGGEFVNACTAFQNDVLNDGLVHLGAAGLNEAVRGADIRPVGEAWAFTAKGSSVDITPLNAVILAAHRARTPVAFAGGFHDLNDY
jgi:hypothetical protein